MSDITISELEQSLAAERRGLDATIAKLRSRIAPGALVAQGRAAVAAQTAKGVSAIERAAVARPLTSAATGLAVAALAIGAHHKTSPSARPYPARNARSSDPAGSRQEALARWEDEGGPPAPDTVSEGAWLDEALSRRACARALLARIDSASRQGAATVAQAAAYRSAILQALARDTAAALGKGLEGVAPTARMTAIRQRERIYLTRIPEAEGAPRTVGDDPIARGLALVAVGAALGCMIRQTEAEHRFLTPLVDELLGNLPPLVPR